MRALIFAIVVCAGCFGTGGGDVICPATAIATEPLRDPSNGVCQSFDGGCRGIPYPDWTPCNDGCAGLGEADCVGTPDCRAIYTGTIAQHAYVACWGTAPNEHLAGGDCTQFDPQTCSEHDDCSALFAANVTPPLSWVSCIPERHLLDPGVCNGPVTCRAAPPACPQGTVPGTNGICYTGYCIPTGDCNGPRDPGTCAGAVCAIVGPACPAGTVPGTANGCYTGYCIPNSACPP